MSARVTIVMYHFVRDLSRSRYPAIRGLTVDAFRGQLAYLRRHYAIVTMEQVLDALEGGGLPPRAALLTFDDGYADHYRNVFPLLDEIGVQGSFFPPACAVLDDRVLDVNKIHFVLAAGPSAAGLVAELIEAVDRRRATSGLDPGASYWERFDASSRYDSREVMFVKRMLQRTLPAPVRAEIIDELFRRHVTTDEAAFARELYVTLDQLRCMRRHGMHVGSHGDSHVWLDAVDPATQTREIERGRELVRLADPASTRWVMCYPYGGYDAGVIGLLRRYECAAALAVDVAIADLAAHDRLALPRLDTNDLPCDAEAPPARWTLEAAETAS